MLPTSDNLLICRQPVASFSHTTTTSCDFIIAGDKHAGIVYCKHGTRTIGEVIRFLQLVNDCLVPHEMRGRIEYL